MLGVCEKIEIWYGLAISTLHPERHAKLALIWVENRVGGVGKNRNLVRLGDLYITPWGIKQGKSGLIWV